MEHTPERRIIEARARYLDYEDEPFEARPLSLAAWIAAWLGTIMLFLVAAMFTLALSLWASQQFGKAWAHEAPLGWKYPLICCSNKDCRPAAEQEVRETPEGYQIASTGEVVPYGNKRIKDSPDGMYHVCQQGGNFDTGRVLCLFVPPRAF